MFGVVSCSSATATSSLRNTTSQNMEWVSTTVSYREASMKEKAALTACGNFFQLACYLVSY